MAQSEMAASFSSILSKMFSGVFKQTTKMADSAKIRTWCHFHLSAFVAMDVLVSESPDFTSSASSIFLVHNLCCDKCILRTYLKVLRLSTEFLASRNTSYENCRLEFVILCSNRWLKIEVTAWQKTSVFCGVRVVAVKCRAGNGNDWKLRLEPALLM